MLLEHLVQGVAGHEAAVHGEGKRLHEEMRVSQMCADLSHLGNRGLGLQNLVMIKVQKMHYCGNT